MLWKGNELPAASFEKYRQNGSGSAQENIFLKIKCLTFKILIVYDWHRFEETILNRFKIRFQKKEEVILMTKADLIATIGKEAKISKASAEKALNAFTTAVMKALKKGDKLTLTGFGTFSVAKRRARTGRNPQTGKEIKIPATRVAKFKAGNVLKSTVK
jgi:DNA-binding protein HU-beta